MPGLSFHLPVFTVPHDKATSALDALSELRVNEAIERILQSHETSTLIVAHRCVSPASIDR
jgi:putative ABC transport system ATP-binding protein